MELVLINSHTEKYCQDIGLFFFQTGQSERPIFFKQAKNWRRLCHFEGTRRQGVEYLITTNTSHSATMVVHLYGTLTPGNMFTFNTNDGYLEALLRGFRSGILTSADYANLIQCDQLEGETLKRSINSD